MDMRKLHHDFVTPIYNLNGWMDRAIFAKDRDDYGYFRRHTGNYIHNRAIQLSQSVGGIDWAYILLSLWKGIGGDPKQVLTDPATMRDHYIELLHEVGYSFEELDAVKPLSKSEINRRAQKFSQEHQALFFKTQEKQAMNESHAKIADQINRAINVSVSTTKPTVAFETVTKHYVFGVEVGSMSENQLIDAIKNVESEIANLEMIEIGSKKVAEKIASLKAMLLKIVEVLDAK